jgi:AraC family transcriptional regulator
MNLTKSPFLLEEYRARMNRVLDYIEEHIGEEFSLDELAGVAAFSKYHFHRIFAAIMGESLFAFITRVRVERAAVCLCNQPKKSITEISGECGFSSSALFSRTFRSRFGMSPSDWRRRCGSYSKESQTDSNEGKAPAWEPPYRMGQHQNDGRSDMEGQATVEGKVTITEFPKMDVAYVRHVGPYMGDGALFERLWGRLLQWAEPRGLFNPPETQMLCVYHDNPEITDSEKLRLSVCITVPSGTEVDGEIGNMVVEGGKYAAVRFEVDDTQYGEAWQWVYGSWLPQSGYQPADGAPFERYPEMEYKDGKMTVDICIPIKPL